MYNIINIRYL